MCSTRAITTQFTVKRQADIERQIREYKLQQAEIARQQAIIQRYRMYNREKSIRAAESREKRLEKMERLERPVDEQHVRFSFEARRRTGEDVLKVHGLAKGFEGRSLFENFDLHLRAGDRVAIIGPNGVGKSTLLNIIARKLKADAGEVEFGANVDLGYYEQHQTGLDPEKDVLNELWDAFPPASTSTACARCWRCSSLPATTFTRKSPCSPAARRAACRCAN